MGERSANLKKQGIYCKTKVAQNGTRFRHKENMENFDQSKLL